MSRQKVDPSFYARAAFVAAKVARDVAGVTDVVVLFRLGGHDSVDVFFVGIKPINQWHEMAMAERHGDAINDILEDEFQDRCLYAYVEYVACMEDLVEDHRREGVHICMADFDEFSAQFAAWKNRQRDAEMPGD